MFIRLWCYCRCCFSHCFCRRRNLQFLTDLQEVWGFQNIFIVFVNQIGIGRGVIKFLGYFRQIIAPGYGIYRYGLLDLRFRRLFWLGSNCCLRSSRLFWFGVCYLLGWGVGRCGCNSLRFISRGLLLLIA